MTRILLKPAMSAAPAAMKVLPVPISPTTVVPRWASRERAAPLMASACAPRGDRSRRGELVPVLRGPVEGWVGLHHPLCYRVLVAVYESCQVHVFLLPYIRVCSWGCFPVVDKGRGPAVLLRTDGAS